MDESMRKVFNTTAHLGHSYSNHETHGTVPYIGEEGKALQISYIAGRGQNHANHFGTSLIVYYKYTPTLC